MNYLHTIEIRIFCYQRIRVMHGSINFMVKIQVIPKPLKPAKLMVDINSD